MGKGNGGEESSCESCASCLRGEEDRMGWNGGSSGSGAERKDKVVGLEIGAQKPW